MKPTAQGAAGTENSSVKTP